MDFSKTTTYWHFVRALPYYVIESNQSLWDSGSRIDIMCIDIEDVGIISVHDMVVIFRY